MKNLLFFVVLSVLFVLQACNNAPKNTEETLVVEEKTNTTNPIDTNTISYATFQQWTALWDSLGTNYSDTALVKYYNFPIIDMAEFLGQSATKAYFYQGLQPLGSGKYMAHIILTGTNAKGDNIGKYYDVSRPCPPVCGH